MGKRNPNNTATHKFRARCGQVKLRTEFYRNRGKGDGYQGQCKSCGIDSKRESIHRNLDYYRAMNRRHAAERRIRCPEAIRSEKRRDYEKNRDRYSRSRERWFKANPDARQQMHRLDRMKRRAREAAAYEEQVEPIVIWARDDGICHICKEEVSFYQMHLDHVVPIVRGGKHSYSNIKASHPDCNQWKHARFMHELPVLEVAGPTPLREQCNG